MAGRKRTKEPKTEFGWRILQLAGDKSIPQFASELGVKNQNLYGYLNGVQPTLPFIHLLLDKTGANPIWLLTGEGPQTLEEQQGLVKQAGRRAAETLAAAKPSTESDRQLEVLEEIRDLLRRVAEALEKQQS